MGLQFGALVGGSVVVETVFAWPGVGWLMIQSIEARDLPVIRAAVLVLAVFIVLINLVVDVLYTVIDPRIRLEPRPWS
jgi:ABC-type dipeptide/oligopeptide/nickel transport system permease component